MRETSCDYRRMMESSRFVKGENGVREKVMESLFLQECGQMRAASPALAVVGGGWPCRCAGLSRGAAAEGWGEQDKRRQGVHRVLHRVRVPAAQQPLGPAHHQPPSLLHQAQAARLF